ncbi:unnamed protein product [Brugia timori]|uniref:Uncharacterized protein n=1 Tax=Brugia timori TaxID=42155 RepID=A0A3P7SIR7_9BILA|nr:unnamed protein product [Brugia timori]
MEKKKHLKILKKANAKHYYLWLQIDSHLELSFLQLKPSEYEQQRKEKLVPTADVEDDLEDDKI